MSQPNENLRFWDALGKTDPAQTKGFTRAGGFRGTAIKPIWIEKRLTETFGPCGIGWGVGEPTFTTMPAGDEILVYCTLSCWYREGGEKAAILYGVGGDKVLQKTRDGLRADDEAFKKSFTDALGNAFKHLGAGADIHMGLFDDSKYVSEMQREFANDHAPEPTVLISTDQRKTLIAAADEVGADKERFCKAMGVDSFAGIPASRYAEAVALLEKKRARNVAAQ